MTLYVFTEVTQSNWEKNLRKFPAKKQILKEINKNSLGDSEKLSDTKEMRRYKPQKKGLCKSCRGRSHPKWGDLGELPQPLAPGLSDPLEAGTPTVLMFAFILDKLKQRWVPSFSGQQRKRKK